jgi:hypothetical protein
VLVREDHAYLPHQLCLNFLRNRRSHDLEDICRDSLNRQRLAFFYSRAGAPCQFLINHRQHEGVPKQVAHLWWLLTQKIGDTLKFTGGTSGLLISTRVQS